MSSTITKPHATHRIDYLLKTAKADLARGKAEVEKALASGNFTMMLDWHADLLATQDMRQNMINYIEHNRVMAAEHDEPQEVGDFNAINGLIKEMFKIVLTMPVHNSTNSATNLINEKKIEFARMTLDRLGIDAYRFEGNVLEAILKNIVPNAFTN